MKKILLNNPGLSTMNLGDKVIAESAKNHLDFILNENFVVEVPTHLPYSYYYLRSLSKADLKFVLGSNLLKSTFFGIKRQWDISLTWAWAQGPCILVGAGWWQYGNEPNIYTKTLLKKILDRKILHSVRDSYTVNMLNACGIRNVINTGCPTMWSLTSEHCEDIRKEKSRDVVFTLTDYFKDFENDKKIVEILLKEYSGVYFWPQGIGDLNYLKELGFYDRVNKINPNLEAFDKILENLEIDYVGTRLHGGIRALQKKKRTIIISIDNRAEELTKDFSIPVEKREDLSSLYNRIMCNFSTEIEIPSDNIKLWKAQF